MDSPTLRPTVHANPWAISDFYKPNRKSSPGSRNVDTNLDSAMSLSGSSVKSRRLYISTAQYHHSHLRARYISGLDDQLSYRFLCICCNPTCCSKVVGTLATLQMQCSKSRSNAFQIEKTLELVLGRYFSRSSHVYPSLEFSCSKSGHERNVAVVATLSLFVYGQFSVHGYVFSWILINKQPCVAIFSSRSRYSQYGI